MSHNSADKLAVEEVARRLLEVGLQPWLDSWYLVPGEKWQPALERAIVEARASLVFFGPSGIGPWQDEEMRVAIDRRVGDPDYRVIPVLLPGAERGRRSAVPPFLANATWVEFNRSLDEEATFRRLIAGIEGRPPETVTGTVLAGTNPYVGLRVFDVADHARFFGREALTGWFISALRGSLARRGELRLFAVVGASGSGKSSLARAGLLASLQRDAIEGSASWRYCILKPGSDPVGSLAVAASAALGLADVQATLRFQDAFTSDARVLHSQSTLALRSAPRGTRLVLLIDQFEEIFTLCDSEPRRRALIDNLLHAAAAADGPIVVLLALRADFVGRCAAYDGLATAISEHHGLVGPMHREELRQAIERPAWQYGYEFQPGLVDVLLDDVEAQPGALPLLQHALSELWREREGTRHLTHDAYVRIHRVQGALARRADDVYGAFTTEEQAVARRLLLRLTQPGDGTEDTRRRAPLDELIGSADRSVVVSVVDRMVDERLLVTEDSIVDVAHEALIRYWPALQQWLDRDREGLREHRRLTLAAEEWKRLQRDPSALYAGLKLEMALAWGEEHDEDLNELERSFLAASQRRRDEENDVLRRQESERDASRLRELEQAKRLAEESQARAKAERDRTQVAEAGRTRQRRIAVVAGVLAILAVVAAWVANRSADTARDQLVQATSLRLTAEVAADVWSTELNGVTRTIFSSLAAHSLTSREDGLSRAAALGAIQRTWFRFSNLRHLIETNDKTHALTVSPLNDKFATASDSGLVRLWALDSKSPRLVADLRGHKGPALSIAFSPDGRVLASGGIDGTIRLWNVETGTAMGEPIQAHNGSVLSVNFSPNGRRLLTASFDGTLRQWDLSTREMNAPALRMSSGGILVARYIDNEGKTILGTEHGTLLLWDPKRSKGATLLGRHLLFVFSIAISLDGTVAASVGGDNAVRLWDLASGKAIGEPIPVSGPGPLMSVTIDPRGEYIAVAGSDGKVRLIGIAARKEVESSLSLDGPNRILLAVAFSANASQLLAAGEDGIVYVWDVHASRPVVRRLDNEWNVFALAFSPDGSRLAAGGGHTKIWTSDSAEPLKLQTDRHRASTTVLAYSPDGQFLVTGSADTSLQVWNAKTLDPTGPLFVGHSTEVKAVAISPDSRVVASSAGDGSVLLWDISSGKQLGRVEAAGSELRTSSLAFSAHGDLLLVGGSDGLIRQWSIPDQSMIEPAIGGHKGPVRALYLTPDGRKIVSAGADSTLRASERTTGRALGAPIFAHQSQISGLAFSRDGKLFASFGGDGIQLWSTESMTRIGAMFSSHEGAVESAAFSPDGTELASGGVDGKIFLWPVSTSWAKALCQKVGRNMTQGEWDHWVSPDLPYRVQCPELPTGARQTSK